MAKCALTRKFCEILLTIGKAAMSNVSHRAIVLTLGASCLAGCELPRGDRSSDMFSGSNGQPRVHIHIVRCPDPEDSRAAQWLSSAITPDETDEDIILRTARGVIRIGNPYLISDMMTRLAGWGDKASRVKLYPLLSECLRHPEPSVRWDSIFVGWVWRDDEFVRRALQREYPSVSIRLVSDVTATRAYAQYLPSWRSKALRDFPADALQGSRAVVISLLGEYDIQAAVPALRTILADKDERNAGVRRCAEEALRQLTGND